MSDDDTAIDFSSKKKVRTRNTAPPQYNKSGSFNSHAAVLSPSQKKAKPKADAEEQKEAPADPAEDDEDIDFSKKKKKKPKAKTDEDEEAKPAAADDDDEDLDFSKKKKKKPKAKDGDEEEAASKPAAAAADDDDDEDLSFGAKKKKKKPKADAEEEDDEEEAGPIGIGDDDESDDDDDGAGDDAFDENDDGAGGFVSIPADREYKYEELLDRMYSLLHANNPELAGDRKRFLIKPPQVVREGSKRVVLVNFGDICKTLNRSMDHVYSFMLAEMGTTGSIDASSRMVIKGRFPPKAIEQIIRRYVGEYVSCSSCKSPATTLQKQNRLYFMQCNNCGARRSVTPIKTGFVAISRGARKKNRV